MHLRFMHFISSLSLAFTVDNVLSMGKQLCSNYQIIIKISYSVQLILLQYQLLTGYHGDR